MTHAFHLPKKHVTLISKTPLTFLPRLSKQLEIQLWVKRDDLLPVGMEGNKLRKLEYLLSDAMDIGADCILTAGAMQSNHCRLTAAACAMYGFECHLALAGVEPGVLQGNLLLDKIFGAQIHWSGDHRKGELLPQIAAEMRTKGKRPYVIPYGGSNEIGAMGFVDAAMELHAQLSSQGIDRANIVIASSSGGTQSGLTVGADLLEAKWKIHAIAIDKGEAGELPFAERLTEISNATAEKLHVARTYAQKDFFLHENYVGKGYGIVGSAEQHAISLLARTEGLLVDPVYTGRAFAGCLDLLFKGILETSTPVIFWHTGGLPALFAHEQELLSSEPGNG